MADRSPAVCALSRSSLASGVLMTVRDLAGRVRGQVLTGGDLGFYEACRVWNGRFSRRPDVIARCESADDVAQSVQFARERQLTISVRGGGHSYSGRTVGDGGLLIDLSPMKAVRIDARARIADAEGGVTCAELDRASQAHGLATPLPTVSSVGVAGAALGGGAGYLSRRHGLTLDNLISADIVTADGRQLTVSAEQHEELFWAVRGAGPNFGIATSLKLRLHEVGPEVLAGQIIHAFENAGQHLRAWRDYMAAAPDDLQCYPFMFRIPPIEAFPREYHGQPAIDFVLCHADPAAAGVVEPLRRLGRPILDIVGPAAYTQVQQTFDPNLPGGQRYYSKAHDLEQLSDGAIDIAITHVNDMQGAFSAAYFDPAGGAIGAVDSAATAFAGRQATCGLHILAGWTNAAEDRPVMQWARSFHEAMAPHAMRSVYVHLLGEDEGERVAAAYGANYARLVSLKAKWDPDNVFRMNNNVKPPPSSSGAV
jgi:FAD/FMN-containing dehydrogenase